MGDDVFGTTQVQDDEGEMRGAFAMTASAFTAYDKRYNALCLAHNTDEPASKVIKRAEAYLKFMQG